MFALYILNDIFVDIDKDVIMFLETSIEISQCFERYPRDVRMY